MFIPWSLLPFVLEVCITWLWQKPFNSTMNTFVVYLYSKYIYCINKLQVWLLFMIVGYLVLHLPEM